MRFLVRLAEIVILHIHFSRVLNTVAHYTFLLTSSNRTLLPVYFWYG